MKISFQVRIIIITITTTTTILILIHYIHTCIHTYIHTHIHTYIHTHIHILHTYIFITGKKTTRKPIIGDDITTTNIREAKIFGVGVGSSVGGGGSGRNLSSGSDGGGRETRLGRCSCSVVM